MNMQLKTLITFISLFLFSGLFTQAVIHEKVSRTFKSSDGREVTATLEGYNPIAKEVTLRMANGTKHDLPLDRFSEEDQSFILEWREDYDASFVRVDFFTNRIDAGRIVFMLDSSGSMRGDRWDKMVRNMVDVIKRLDTHAQFNIILFGSDARVFSPVLMPADDESKQQAEFWLRSKSPGGGTNLLAAIKAAEPMEKADVYAILSDGYPAGEPDAIFNAIIHNRKVNDRMVRVFGVSYQSSTRGQEFMKMLSGRFDGNYARR